MGRDDVIQHGSARERRIRKVLRRLDRSGLSLREFGKTVGIPAGTLAFWRHEIRRRERLRQGSKGGPGPVPALNEGIELIPVRLVSSSASPQASGIGDDRSFELSLPGGGMLRVPGCYSDRVLEKLLALLGGQRC